MNNKVLTMKEYDSVNREIYKRILIKYLFNDIRDNIALDELLQNRSDLMDKL